MRVGVAQYYNSTLLCVRVPSGRHVLFDSHVICSNESNTTERAQLNE